MGEPTNYSQRTESQSEIPPLNQLYFYLTEGCNLACRHCWLAPKFDPEGTRYATLPVEFFDTAIREAKPLGLTTVKFTGGEPLLHPEIKKLLEIVRREDLSLTIETNGLLCTPEMASEIAKSPDRFVSVSMDGADAATHDWVRGIKGSFIKAQEAVQNLTAADTAPQIIMSLMRCNVDQVVPMIQMAENLGAASVKFNVIQPAGRGERIHEDADGIDVAELIALSRYVEMELAPSTPLQLHFDTPLAFRPLSRMASGDGCNICGILGILGVLPGGEYALCGIGEHVPELVFGKVGRDRLEDVWRESSILNELRTGLPNHLMGVCQQCVMKHRCLGSCIAQNYYSKGTLWAGFWFCEAALDAGLFPVTRVASEEQKSSQTAQSLLPPRG